MESNGSKCPLSLRFGLDFSEDEVDQINSHRSAEREGREEEEKEERKGKSFKEVDEEVVEISCQIENREAEVKVGIVERNNPSFSVFGKSLLYVFFVW